MNRTKKCKNSVLNMIPRWVFTILVVVLLLSAIPVTAWFYYERKIAAVIEIDSPLAIHINAGNKEDVEYLDLSDIDDTDPSHPRTIDGKEYYSKDFVFYVMGDGISQFRLQLAFTTNNQYLFEVYNAEIVSEPVYVTLSDEEKNEIVNYETHDDTPAIIHYKATGTKIDGTFLNPEDGSVILGKKDDDPYYKGAKKTYDSTDLDNNISRYAMPLYWQSVKNPKIDAIIQPDGSFSNMFILRVLWDKDKKAKNFKETDIIYIAAKAG